MEPKALRILVLSDLGSTTDITLRSAVSLAKMVNGTIDLFYVKKPGDIVQKENQLSAIRSINEEKNSTNKLIQERIKTTVAAYGVPIDYSFSFGNVKNEIDIYIKNRRPDIIVMGKKQPKLFNLGSDGLTQFVMDTHQGVMMIVGTEHALEPNQPFSLGVFNGANFGLARSLKVLSNQPLKSFKIAYVKDNSIEQQQEVDTIEYVFEEGDESIKNLSNYLSKSSVNLFCVERGHSKTENHIKTKHTDILNIANTINISLLVSAQ